MKNLFTIICNARYEYLHLFNNFIISKSLADETIEIIKQYTSGYSNAPKAEYILPNNSDGTIFGIPFYIDKYLPDNMLLLRNDEKIIDILYL